MAYLLVLNAYLDPSTIFKGILVKIIIIVFLIKGLNDAKEAQRMQDEFNTQVIYSNIGLNHLVASSMLMPFLAA